MRKRSPIGTTDSSQASASRDEPQVPPLGVKSSVGMTLLWWVDRGTRTAHLLQMHRRLYRLRPGGCGLAHLRHYWSVLRLDVVTRRIAIHSLMRFVGRRIGHRRRHRGIAIRFQFLLDARNQLFVFRRGQPLLLV